MPHVEVLVGSKSDLPMLERSNLLRFLREAEVDFRVSVCSAHRNLPDLIELIEETYPHTDAYVCIAGWAAALPGTVKALLLRKKHVDVYGVALSSDNYPDALDAQLGIKRLPPGVPVVYCGVNVQGLDVAGVNIVNSLPQLPSTEELERLLAEDIQNIKPPQIGINLSEA